MIRVFKNQLFFLLLISIGFSTSVFAQNDSINLSKDTITVALAGSQPFIIQNNSSDDVEGIAADIWSNLSRIDGWKYRYKSYNSVKKALNAVESGKADIAVGPISITADRLQNLNFSQPFYNSSLSIISNDDASGIWGHIKPFLSIKLLGAVVGFLLLLAIVGTLFWLAERKTSPDQFSSKPLKGIGNGMWLAIVTMSTVGYGDMAPRTALGRIIAGTWIVIAIIFATSMVAGIASTLTLAMNSSSTVNTIEELSGRKTATIAGSPATGFIKENHGKLIEAKDLDEAMDMLENKKVDAVVYDRPQLLYYKNNHKDKDLFLAGAEYYKQGYGFAFPQNSRFVYDVNLKLLKLAESRKVLGIVEDYLGDENAE